MKQFFTEDNNRLSMKRLCGFFCTLTLCITTYHNSFSELNKAPSEALVYAVAGLAAACLVLTAAEKIWKKEEETKS